MGGMPRPGPEKPKIQFRDTLEMRQRLTTLAERDGVSESDVLRDLVREGMAARERRELRRARQES